MVCGFRKEEVVDHEHGWILKAFEGLIGEVVYVGAVQEWSEWDIVEFVERDYRLMIEDIGVIRYVDQSLVRSFQPTLEDTLNMISKRQPESNWSRFRSWFRERVSLFMDMHNAGCEYTYARLYVTIADVTTGSAVQKTERIMDAGPGFLPMIASWFLTDSLVSMMTEIVRYSAWLTCVGIS